MAKKRTAGKRRPATKRTTKRAAKRPPAFFVHPKGLAEGEIGPRTRVWAFAHVLKGARVGADCNICECAFVEGGAVLGDHVTVKNGVQIWDGVTCEDYVFLGPNATLTNDIRPRVAHPSDAFAKTHIGYGATIGANATIVAGHAVGAHAMIGAGAVVTCNVPAHALMLGVPARRVGWVCVCGASIGADLSCPACGKQFEETAAGLAPRRDTPAVSS